MRWDAEELPVEALQQRLARLRAAMQREKLDAMLIYTTLVRPSAVNWLTGFTPYWSEGALLVLGSGAPIFATALSKRVANWMRTVDPVSEIVNAPRPGKLLGERLTTGGNARRLGVLELDALPAGIHDDFAGAAPSLELIDASAAFASVRRTTDDAERRLLERADTMAIAALDQIDAAAARDAGAVAGQVEQHARLAGAEEAYIAVASDLDADRRLIRIVKPAPLGQRFAVRASIAYKGAWVRRTRTFARDTDGHRAVTRVEPWFDDMRGTIDPAKPLAGQIEARVKALAGARLQGWLAEGCLGSYPLQAVAASGAPAMPATTAGDTLVVTLSLTVDGVPWLGAGPVARPSR
jgi:hypothetical protein